MNQKQMVSFIILFLIQINKYVIILIAPVIACFITFFSLVLFLISLVNNNTKINKIRFEKIIEEKIYAEIPPEILSNILKQQLITKLSPIKEKTLPSHEYHTKYIDFLHESYTTQFFFNFKFFQLQIFSFFFVINFRFFLYNIKIQNT